MRISKFTLALAVAGMFSAGHAFAQEGTSYELTGNTPAYDAYYSQKEEAPSPSDAPMAKDKAGAGAAAAASDSGCGCDSGCCDSCSRCCPLECPEAETYRLFDELCFLKCRNATLTGYLDVGGTINGRSPASNFNGPISFNDRDELQMNQWYMILEKVADNQGCGLALGGRADVMYGTDARFIQSFGLETHQDGSNKWNGQRFYQLAVPQLYAEVAVNDWKIKLGKFVTPCEYEVIDARGNYFYSHSYGFLYGVPFTHTGLYATRAIGDTVQFGVGFHRGWERWEDDNDELAFMSHATWTSCDKKTSATLAFTTGDEAGINGVDDNRTAYSLIITRKMWCDRLTYVFVHDNGIQNNGVGALTQPGGPTDAHWYSFNQYLMYQINCCWSAGARLEYFRDEDGTRVAQTISGNPAAGPFRGNFWEATWGANWKPNDNLTVRPELRYDWFEGAGNPFDDGNASDQFTAALDVILHF